MKTRFSLLIFFLFTSFGINAQSKKPFAEKSISKSRLPKVDNDFLQAASVIDTTSIWHHLRALAHDSMMGRRPGTAGDKMTIRYLSKAFAEAGLTPAYGNSYLQPVRLIHTSSSGNILFKKNGDNFLLADSSFIIASKHSIIKLDDASLLFAGYGIIAPEFGWDDYKGKNVRGKVVIIMDNEPQTLSSIGFGAKGAITYHWSYMIKYQIAR
ncbi:MAG: hypothetical protein M3Y85_04860, partial [Bacteroidota bacterium]|nr:hypothetical protein [Bacteroidota bacterium]